MGNVPYSVPQRFVMRHKQTMLHVRILVKCLVQYRLLIVGILHKSLKCSKKQQHRNRSCVIFLATVTKDLNPNFPIWPLLLYYFIFIFMSFWCFLLKLIIKILSH